MIVLACTGVGIHAVRRLVENERLWQAWVRLLTHLYTELRYTARPVQEILAALRQEDFRPLMWLSEFGSATGMDCPKSLCAQERSFAESFFAFVGTSDLEGQLTHTLQYTERAKEMLATVSERRERLSKVYLSTAVCAGISTAIMML